MSPRMVLIVATLEPRLGLERAVIDLANELAKSVGVEVVCIGGAVPSGIDETIEVSILGSDLRGWRRVNSVARIRKWLRKARSGDRHAADVYVACGAWVAVPAAIARVPRLVIWEHSLRRGRSRISAQKRLSIVEFMARLLYPRARLVVAVSEPLARDIRRWSNRMSARVISIPNAVNPPSTPRRIRGVDEPLRVLAVGSLTRLKNQGLLVEAMQYLPDSARAWIVGSGPLAAEIAKRVVALGLTGRVELKGFLEGEELESAFKWANVLAHPSLSETFGMVLFEAADRGLPVVALDTPVVTDFVGPLVPGAVSSPDPESFARSLTHARLSVPEEQVVEGIRRRAEYCSPRRVAERWQEAILGMELERPRNW